MQGFIPLISKLPPEQYDLVGGKGKGLSHLLYIGANVPSTVCIPPKIDPGKILKDILQHFSDPEGKQKYAIRSSAAVEDGSVRSYAGQFDSFLRISGFDDIVEAVEKCRRSGAGDRVKSYMGGNKKGIPVSVLIQEMIEADFAGALFSCDPVSGSRNYIVVEMVQGTSEHLLSGREAGDRYFLDRTGRLTEGTEVPAALEKILEKMVLDALEIEEKFGDLDIEGPLDFEWAVKSGEIFWLQVRPVTAMGNNKISGEEILFLRPGEFPEVKPGEIHWTSLNAREALPGVITPLSSDMCLGIITRAFVEVVRRAGFPMDNYSGNKALQLFNGRAFLGVTALKELIGFLPLKNADIMIDKLLGGDSSARAEFKFSFKNLVPILKNIFKEIKLESLYREFEEREVKHWKYPDEKDLRKLENRELHEKMAQINDFFEPFLLHVMGTNRYMFCYSIIENVCMNYGADPAEMIRGIGTLRFASASAALRDVAYCANRTHESIFDENFALKENWRDRIENEPDLIEFREKFNQYLEEYGHLGNGTIDSYLKTWREEPERLLKLVGDLLKTGNVVDRKEYLRRLEEKRGNSIDSLRKKLSLLDKIKFAFGLRMMHGAAPLRENVKFYIHRRIAISKDYLMECARRMVEIGIIEKTDDIFFLKTGEVKQFLVHGDKSSHFDVIELRNNKYRRLTGLPCPLHRVEGPGGVRLYFAAPAGDGGEFQGVAASAGTSVGKARVILNLHDSGKLQPGEILFTSSTDPSWTPLFSIAGAIVVEIGSMLSHGAVVAREVGIPAVLGIPGILGAVKDGDEVVVDGSTGKVTINPKEERN